MSKYGWGSVTKIKAMVNIRPEYDGQKAKPSAVALNGMVFDFDFQWLMDENDPYPGEIAWAVHDIRKHLEEFPDAPTWMASGDLEIITEAGS